MEVFHYVGDQLKDTPLFESPPVEGMEAHTGAVYTDFDYSQNDTSNGDGERLLSCFTCPSNTTTVEPTEDVSQFITHEEISRITRKKGCGNTTHQTKDFTESSSDGELSESVCSKLRTRKKKCRSISTDEDDEEQNDNNGDGDGDNIEQQQQQQQQDVAETEEEMREEEYDDIKPYQIRRQLFKQLKEVEDVVCLASSEDDFDDKDDNQQQQHQKQQDVTEDERDIEQDEEDIKPFQLRRERFKQIEEITDVVNLLSSSDEEDVKPFQNKPKRFKLCKQVNDVINLSD